MSYAEPFFHMPRELLILRHAKSDWDSGAGTDFDRPLSRRGKHDAPRIGAWLYREGLVPDYVVRLTGRAGAPDRREGMQKPRAR